MKYSFGLQLVALVSLAACGHPNSDKPTSATGPTDIRTEAQNARSLTPEQKARLAQMFKSEASINPSTDLYFGTSNSSSQSSLDRLNAEGRAFLAKVRSSCAIDSGKPQAPGAAAAVNTLTKTISGKDCPIFYSEKNVDRLDTKYDATTKSVSGTSHNDNDETTKIIDPTMRRRVLLAEASNIGFTDSVFNQVITGEDGKITSGTINVTGSSTTTGVTFDGRKMTGKIKTAMLVTAEGTKAQVLMSIQTPDQDSLVIGLFSENGKQDILLNGEAYTVERFREEFGTDMGFKN
jgi:hypothetical protein